PSWPTPEDVDAPAASWQPLIPIAVVLAILFVAGWFLGRPNPDENGGKTSFIGAMLRQVGLGGPRYDCAVKSWPAGAMVAVDGKPTGRRTPTTLELKPGEHEITLSFAELGAASFAV